MALTAAELVAYLRLDKGEFDSKIRQARGDLQNTQGKFREWTSGMARATASALTAGAAGASALAVQVFRTGANYNTLQQQSRAALTTIFDDGAKANAQMDELDDFAKNSPFAKDVFIRAQQQLLGFGMEAEDVVPTLGAIQDSVAAVGGSDQDILEISNVLAKVTGTGKITATTLDELGIRGVNAAEIIGEQMGMTGNEVREAITDGSIDAGEAVKALTEGMTENFGGAAANVKDTAVGAADRIKAAWRDIGSVIATPFIDPKGGGMAVDWMNQFADVLRAVERQAGPLTDVLVKRMSPAFDNVTIVLKEAKDAVDSLSLDDLETGLDAVGRHAPSIAAVSGALFTLTASNIPGLRHFAGAIGPIPAAMAAAAAASPEMRDKMGDLGEKLSPLGDLLFEVAELASTTFTEGVGLAADVLGLAVDIIGPVIDGFDKLPGPIKTATGVLLAFTAARKMFPRFQTSLDNMATKVSSSFGSIRTGSRNVVDSFGSWHGAFQGATGNLGDFRAAVGLTLGEVGRSATAGLRGAASGLVSFLGGPWGIAMGAATIAIGFWAKQQQEAKAYAQELSGSLDEQTGALTENSEELVAKALQDEISAEKMDEMGISLADVTDAALGNEDAMKRVRDAVEADTEAKIAALPVDEGYAGASMAIETMNNKVITSIEDQIEVIKEEQELKRQLIEAEEERYRLMDDGQRSYQRYQEAMQVVVDETINMDERVRALNDALDELNGVSATQEERDRNLAATQRDLNSFFEDNAEEIANMDEALVDMSTGMGSHTELGDRLNTMLEGMKKESQEGAIAIRDRGEAEGWSGEKIREEIEASYKPYISTLQDLQDQGYLSQDQVDALTSSIIGVPEITSYIITHGDSVTQTTKDVIALTGEIESVPDGKTYISDEGTSQDVIDELIDLGYTVKELPEGKVEVTPIGIPEAEAALQEWIGKKRTIKVSTSIETGASAGKKGGPSARAGASVGNKRGGIDTFRRVGMADGGVTEPNATNVMDVAQMVAPGDIRYAGDRSDVDEAWIPLDGSVRSISILQEAIDRMPNFDISQGLNGIEGMFSGGITGPGNDSSSRSIPEPESEELEGSWQDAMELMSRLTDETFDEIAQTTRDSQHEVGDVIRSSGADMADDTRRNQSAMSEDTRSAQEQMRSNTQASQEQMRANTQSSQDRMRQQTRTAQSSMSSDVQSYQKSMGETTRSSQEQMRANTQTAQERMRQQTRTSQSDMSSTTSRENTNRVKTTASANQSMTQDTRAKMTSMRTDTGNQLVQMSNTTRQNMENMRSSTASATARMRSAAGREFTNMKSQGITATQQLRSGIVSEMSAAQTPFTNEINDLVNVLRNFSDAINDAYGDMGVSIGKPTRLATGGVLGGYSPGSDIHTFQSPTGGELRLSGGESIMRPEVTRVMGSSWVNTMNSAAQRGGVSAVKKAAQKTQRFSTGGIFDDFAGQATEIRDTHKANLPKSWTRPIGESVMDDVTEALQTQLEQMLSGDGWTRPTTGRVTSRYGAGRGAHPHAGMDIAKGEGTPTVAPIPGIVRDTGWNIGPGRSGIGALIEHAGNLFTYYGHNPVGGLKVKTGDMLLQGDRIGAQGNTGNSTGAHLHWEVHQNRAWNDVNPHPYWDAAGGGGGAGGAAGGSDRWAPTIRAALSANGLPTSANYVSAWLRQIQTESGGNPKARQRINDINMRMGNPAMGLLQVIPPTFAAYSRSGHKNILNPLDNALAAIAYAKARYGASGMLNAIGKGQGYQNGVNSAEPGWHEVGENGPELVRFRGGETVRTNAQSRSLVANQRFTDEDARRFAKALRGVQTGPAVQIDKVETSNDREFFKRLGILEKTHRATDRKVG